MSDPIKIAYTPLPSIKTFHESNARLKILWGPIGCVSADTEFLTSAGWKRIDQYQSGDLVAQWNPETQAIAFSEPRDYVVYPCEEMWSFSNAHGLSMQLSDEHRVPLYDYQNRFKVTTAAELAKAPSKHTIPTTFRPPDGPGIAVSDVILRLRVAINADAYVRNQRIEFSLRKNRKIDRLKQLLDEAGISFVERIYPARPDEHRIWFEWHEPLRKGYDASWWKASESQLRIILEECLLWDGLANHPEERFFTTDSRSADFIQYAAHAIGRRACISVRTEKNSRWKALYCVQITLPDSFRGHVQLRVDTTKIERVKTLDGKKYCFTTGTEFWIARHRARIFITGNTGKTSAGLWEFVLTCLESPIPLDGIVVRSSYRELRDTTLKTWRTWFGSISSWRESDSLITMKLPGPNGKTLEHVLRFRSLEKPDDAKKVQSWEGSFALLDEVAPTFASTGRASEGIPLEIVEYTFARLRHSHGGKPAHRYTQVIVSNPPPPSHWLYKHYLSKDPADLAKKRGGVSVHFVPRSENEKNLREDYYADICDMFHDPDLVRRLVEGEIVATYSGEAVFPEVRDKRHITNDKLRPTAHVPIILGFDYGLTPATLITQITPTGQWRWLSEVQTFNASFDTHLDLLRTHMHDHYLGWEYRCWGDPAGATRQQTDEKTCVEMAAKAGFDIRPGRIDWQSRKEAVKQRLLRSDSTGEPALLVSRPNCPLSAEAFSGAYRYPKSASGEIGTRPIKNHVSHLMDAAQYIATREFSISPSQLPHERIIVPFTPRPLDPFRSPEQPRKRSSWLSR